MLEILKLRLKNILMILNDKHFLNPDGRGNLTWGKDIYVCWAFVR